MWDYLGWQGQCFIFTVAGASQGMFPCDADLSAFTWQVIGNEPPQVWWPVVLVSSTWENRKKSPQSIAVCSFGARLPVCHCSHLHLSPEAWRDAMVGAHAFPPYVEDDGLFVPHFCLFCFSKLYLCISVGPFLLLLNAQLVSSKSSHQATAAKDCRNRLQMLWGQGSVGALLEVDAFFEQQVLNLIGQSIHWFAPLEMNKHIYLFPNKLCTHTHTNAHISCDR